MSLLSDFQYLKIVYSITMPNINAQAALATIDNPLFHSIWILIICSLTNLIDLLFDRLGIG